MIRSQWAFIRGARGAGLQSLDAVGREDRVEGPGVFGVPITDQEPQRVNVGAQPGGQVPGPARSRMPSDAR